MKLIMWLLFLLDVSIFAVGYYKQSMGLLVLSIVVSVFTLLFQIAVKLVENKDVE